MQEKVNIPPSAYRALLSLAGMDAERLEKLTQALAVARPSLSKSAFSKQIVEQVGDEDPTETALVIRELFNLDFLRERLDAAPDQIATIIAASCLDESNDEFPFSDEDSDALKARLPKLLTAGKGLGLTAKAIDVLTEHERAFQNARIITDIRPIFGEAAECIEAAVVIHNLVLSFEKDDEDFSVHIALDTRDVVNLKKVLERAEAKAHSLEKLLKVSSVSYLSP